MMSRKHFNAIASIFKEENVNEQVVYRIANFLKQQNPRFDSSRFIEACKPSDSQKEAGYETGRKQNLRAAS